MSSWNRTSDTDEREAWLFDLERRWRQAEFGLDELTRAAAECRQFAPHDREMLLELVKIDLEYRWRKLRGKLASPDDLAMVESYLRLIPELALDQRGRLELVAEEYRARQRWGDRPSHSDYLDRFPDFALELAGRLAEIDQELARDCEPAWEPPQPETLRTKPAALPTIAASDTPGGRHSEQVEFLCRTRPFSELPEPVVQSLAAGMIPREFAAGELLVRQGAAAAGLVVVVDGEVEVSLVDSELRRRTIDRCGPGTVLGEMSLVSDQPHSADVTATSPVRALVLAVEKLHRMARKFPPLVASFADLAAARLGRREVDALYDKQVGDFRIKRRLGHGGMAVVYAAVEETTGRRVALKMMQHQLAYDLASSKRFQNESETLARLRHPNIVAVEGCFAALNTSFIVMELCEGPTLANLIDRCPPLTEGQAWPILGQLSAALAYAHSQGVIHRDLKPGNVLMKWDGTLKLSDFGLARSLLNQGLTVRGEILGTPRYMPPEQLLGQSVDARADIYALGCIAYELLVGSPLFAEPDVTRLLALQLNWSLEQALAASEPISPEMRQFLAASLAIDPQHRTLDLALISQKAALAAPDLLWVAGLRR